MNFEGTVGLERDDSGRPVARSGTAVTDSQVLALLDPVRAEHH